MGSLIICHQSSGTEISPCVEMTGLRELKLFNEWQQECIIFNHFFLTPSNHLSSPQFNKTLLCFPSTNVFCLNFPVNL